MSAIIIKRARRVQPSYPVPVNRSSSLAHGLKILCDPAISFSDPTGNGTVTYSGALTRVVGRSGLSIQGSATGYVDFGGRFNPPGAATILQILNPGTAVNSFSFTNGSDGYEYLIGAGSSAGALSFRIAAISYGNTTGLNDNQDHVIVSRFTPFVSVETWADTLSRKVTATSGVPAVLGGTLNLRLHNRSTTFYTGKSGLFALWYRALNDGEIAAVLSNPWRILEDETTTVYLPAGVAPGGFKAAWASGSNTILGAMGI
jgi:hypothetical protein